jgi:IS605 OrfB family transposase
LEEYEKNFVENYLHHISKQCVDFAVKNHCKYINIENLKGYDADDKILRNWSYYKLEQYITYKAERYGIIVRKINPCFTSQVCSFCGSYEKGQRKTQSDFLCANENCTSHSEKHKYINADFNAARNIAMSTLYYDGEITNKQIEEAANYYGIVLDENKDKELVA